MNTGTYSSAKEKSDEMAAILRDMSLLIGQERGLASNLETGGNIVSGLGFISNAHALAVRAQDIQQGIFKIIVLGEFKHGKSTLLNSMLGGRVLAARATPCTAIVTMLVYGDSNNVSVYKNGNEIPQVMSLDAFNAEYQLTKEDQEKLNEQGFTYRFQDIDYAQIDCQHSLCANGVRLIDSPGLKESNSRTKITTRFLRQAQAIIFVLNATQIISEDERQFIKENLGKGRLTNIFFVINKINLVDEFEVDDIKKYPKNKNNIMDEKPLIKVVEQPLIKQVEQTKNKKLSDEEQKIKHENKKQYLRDYYEKNRNEINKINTENSKDKYYIRLVRELNNNVIKFENIINLQ